VVYVQLPGRDEPTFSGREVILGPRAGHYYLVASGLVAGERVVTNGNFKIDSALQIEAKPSMMNRSDPAPDAACIGEGLGDLLVAYLPLQAALAGDDDSAAAAAGARVAAAVTAIDCTADGLNAADRGIWEEVRTKLKRAAEQVATAEAIGPRRLALQPLTDSLWTALTRFGYTGRDSLRLFHCPMAMDGAGADWIQHETTTANPYYGAAMLRCGAQTDVLVHPASGAASAAPHGTRPAAVDEREDG
jgi:Cu(I)/Ag(I) efflux system membrane fusion protein